MSDVEKLDLFKDILPHIMAGKKLNKSEQEIYEDKNYNMFMINKMISLHFDGILIVNEINRVPHVSKKMHYYYLINILKKYKRPFQKWSRSKSLEELEIIMNYYNVSEKKAKEYMKLLTGEDILNIKIKMNKGGKNNEEFINNS